MNILKITGKYLDQPLLVAKFQKRVPMGLITGGTLYSAYEIKKEKEEKKLKGIKIGTTMLATIASALLAPNLTNKMFKNTPKNIKSIKQENTKIVDDFIKNINLDEKTQKILEKSKENILSFNEVKSLCNKFKDGEKKEFLNKLITEPENIT